MLDVTGLRVRFGEFTALAGVDLHVPDGSVTAVLGPSGCGKTTLLRAVAGLESHSGTVRWDGADLSTVPPHRRGFGLMFQDYALFPHRSVAENVGFGLRMAGMGPPDVASRVDRLLELVGLTGYGERSTGDLSGGEQQRVALARTLAPSPRLVMLDEPIGALDRTLRDHLMREMRHLFAALDVTVLYVTHDQEEAFALADRVVVMRTGRVEQAGEPPELWHRPASPFVARFLGYAGPEAVAVNAGVAAAPWGPMPVAAPDGTHPAGLRPDAVRLDPEGPITATAVASAFRAGRFSVELTLPGGVGVDVETPDAVTPGTPVRVSIDPDGLVVFPHDPAARSDSTA